MTEKIELCHRALARQKSMEWNPEPGLSLKENMRLDKCPKHADLREEWIRCKKPNCSRCPHGLYIYAVWWDGNKQHRRYIGSAGTSRTNAMTNEIKTLAKEVINNSALS